jgi:N-acylneuraminate cytidylyltransferase
MDSMVEILALIPARGGSKGIPRKNIKELGGHPLIAYSISAGLNSKLVTRTIVSTDDEEIAHQAKEYGAEVPFLRPEAIARDDTRDLPVFLQALSWLQEHEGYQPEVVVHLRPTSPFRPTSLVDQAVQILLDNPLADSVRGVVPSKQNPYKMWHIREDGSLAPVLDTEFTEPYNMPRQELPPTFWQTGHIDVIRTRTIQDGSMSGKMIYAYQIDPLFAVDLDGPLDWGQAESQLSELGPAIVMPPGAISKIPVKTSLLVLDFDGVMTDDRVYVNQHGEEAVAAHRGDGMGIARLKNAGVEVIILSKETNSVVQARGNKLKIQVYQGVDDKGQELKKIIKDKGLAGAQVVYVGNDVNDLPCFPLVGLAVAVADAHSALKEQAGLILKKKGGHGAVREICDLILDTLAVEK